MNKVGRPQEVMPETIDKMVELYNNGHSYRGIQSITGFSLRTIHTYLHQNVDRLTREQYTGGRINRQGVNTMSVMNYNKWLTKAEKQVEKMSPRMVIAMLSALVNRIDGETDVEVIHLDIQGEILDDIAAGYDIDIVYANNNPAGSNNNE